MAKKILIVEDDPDILMAVTQAMEAEGFDVAAAFDISVGEALLQAGRPDLAIVDHGLPDGTGDQFAAKLKSAGTAKIIMYTAQAQRSIVENAISCGAIDYVLKGTGLEELISRVRKHAAAA